jgi:Sec-independent protein secretion pathway component TatC
LTPTPDVINQSLLAGPMLLLYVLSIGVAYLWRKDKNDSNTSVRDEEE